MSKEPRYFNEERYCQHCKKDTWHQCFESGHERDSSSDVQTCTECWRYRVGGGECQGPFIGGG
jgi:hypothetical protein